MFYTEPEFSEKDIGHESSQNGGKVAERLEFVVPDRSLVISQFQLLVQVNKQNGWVEG